MEAIYSNIADFILHFDRYLPVVMEAYGHWIYAFLFIIVFCETGLVVTPFLPGDSLLFACGALAASAEGLSLPLLAVIFLVASITGDACNYEIGRHLGHKILAANSKLIKPEYVRLKLNPVESVIKGKSVVVVDDSIVRGTTSGKIVKLLKDAGAREVHMCISSPPVTDPCYYGIDTSVRKELIASTHTEEEIRQYIGADSLHYISLEGLKRSLDCMDPEGMCYACFNAQYPDNAEETLRQGSKYIFENEG